MNIVSHWGSVLFLFLVVLSLFFQKKTHTKLEPIEIFLLSGFVVIIAASCLSMMNSQDIIRSIKRLGKLQYLIAFIPIYVAIRKNAIPLSTPCLFGVIIAGPVMLGVSLIQIFGLGNYRAPGGYNELVFGSVAIIFTSILMSAVMTRRQTKKLTKIILIAGLCTFYSCVLSGTRGAMITFPLVALFQIAIGRIHWKKKAILLTGVFLFVMAGYTVSYLNQGLLQERLQETITDLEHFFQKTDEETSVAWRILMWKDAITIWKHHPIIGTGLGDFKNDVEKMMATGESQLSTSWKHAHNFYLEYLATTGLIGWFATTFFLLVLPFYIFYSKWRTSSEPHILFPAMAGMSIILSFAFIGLTWYWPARSPMMITYVFCLVIFLSAAHIKKTKHIESDIDEHLL